MKLLVMCEGPNEKRIMELLLKDNRLCFNEDDLLDLTVFHARQITRSAQVKTALNIYPEKVKVLRIGDKQSDKLVIPSEYKCKIESVEKYCTKPELEMLLIIACGLTREYDKVKSSVTPKAFAKKNIKCGKKYYDNSTSFYSDYFENNINALVDAIKEYQRMHGKTHLKEEHCLAELLN